MGQPSTPLNAFCGLFFCSFVEALGLIQMGHCFSQHYYCQSSKCEVLGL
ncbi:hypothetical protein AAZX31_03G065300 [Glycine max]